MSNPWAQGHPMGRGRGRGRANNPQQQQGRGNAPPGGRGQQNPPPGRGNFPPVGQQQQQQQQQGRGNAPPAGRGQQNPPPGRGNFPPVGQQQQQQQQQVRGNAPPAGRGQQNPPRGWGNIPPVGQQQQQQQQQPSQPQRRPAEQPASEINVSSLAVALPSGDSAAAAAVGRGAMRGRRRINESECLVTKPSACGTKIGTFGTKIELQSNYFQLMTNSQNWNLYEYRVDFAPQEDRTGVRKGLLRLHREQLGAYIFDGTVMYTSSKLVQPPQELELFSMRQSDEAKIKINIRMVGELKKGDYHYISFFNIVMRKCLDYLELKLVGRNFFDPRNKIEVRTEKIILDLWPGYLTSIRQCEYNILMCSEITHKLMLQKTVLNVLEEAFQMHRDNYEAHFSQQILGQVVLTDYNNNHYRIDDIDFTTRPSSTFKLKSGESVSYQDYYAKKYGIRIKNQSQPMLVSRSKPKDRRAGQAELIYLVPELCRLTGLTDDMRSDFRTMNALATYTKLDPRTRIERLKSFNARLLREPKVVKELSEWGLKLDNNLTNVKGRVIPKEPIYMADGKVFNVQGGSWDNEIRANKMLVTANLKDWVVIVPQRMMQECKDLVSGIIKAARGMYFPMTEPRINEIRNDSVVSYMQALEHVMSRANPQMILFIVPNNNVDRYAAIKSKCCVDRPVLSQVVMKRTVYAKGKPNFTAATKIAIQINCKLGGAPWTVNLPEGNIMVAGFDVCHDKSARGRDYGALVASLNKNFGRYFSSVNAHNNGEELSNSLSVDMVKACHKYKSVNGVLPSTIIFYRDGVGEGQIPFVMDIEVEQIKDKLNALYGDSNAYKFAFIIVTKRINSRFFYQGQNAPPGTVVDDVVTNPARFDFFLISQSGGRGTVTPSSYNVVHDTTNWGPDRIQRMTYKLTQMYYNFCGPVKVPAPCQYAHKLAALIGQAIQKEPSTQLETLLYYL
ncbi:piwi-like protein Siwi [Leptopilina heterotoma]|uniref:piwi-like protein Siwi n=1 Tax=Leptopilina heterotoma TaxID=63436 RepID=UPI001CA8102A|nr:piwi-like protein Siwi [Leptopilina heterotoma]XP_043484451.1 piwi-like protein Siwi [Leptopilina heterotoma]